MSTVIAVLFLVLLFLAFPLVKRENTGGGGCGTGGCWKRRVGLGCGSCPLDPPDGDARVGNAGMEERPPE